MEYKKLNNIELRELYRNLQGYFGVDEKYQGLVSLVNKYFKNASSILVVVDSEYNDSTYDNKFVGVYVYDAEDIEIPMSREARSKFTDDINNIDIDIPYQTENSLDDFVIYVNKSLPDVYIKVK